MNFAGQPTTKSEKSSVVKANQSEMASITEGLSSAKSNYQDQTSIINSLNNDSLVASSAVKDRFSTQYGSDITGIMGAINGQINEANKSMRLDLANGRSMVNRYQQLQNQNDDITGINARRGAELAKLNAKQTASQSAREDKMAKAYFPEYSFETSLSASTSASIAALSPSERDRKLNKIALKRHKAGFTNNDDNGRIGKGWTLPGYDNGGR